MTWFGLWELRLHHDSGAEDPVVAHAPEVQTAVANLVDRAGPGGLLLLTPGAVSRLRARRSGG